MAILSPTFASWFRVGKPCASSKFNVICHAHLAIVGIGQLRTVNSVGLQLAGSSRFASAKRSELSLHGHVLPRNSDPPKKGRRDLPTRSRLRRAICFCPCLKPTSSFLVLVTSTESGWDNLSETKKHVFLVINGYRRAKAQGSHVSSL